MPSPAAIVRATIFHDDEDYRAYLDRLERYHHHDGVTLHAHE